MPFTRERFCKDCGKKLGKQSCYKLNSFCGSCVKKGNRNPMYGKSGRVGMKHSLESLKKMSIAQNRVWADKNYREMMSRIKMGKPGYWTGKHRHHMTGEKHWFWEGGKTEEAVKIRNSMEYKQWRLAVFTRDNFTCKLCGGHKSKDIEVDHIFAFSDYPELRLDIENGRTLCKECHRKTINYGTRKGKSNVIYL